MSNSGSPPRTLKRKRAPSPSSAFENVLLKFCDSVSAAPTYELNAQDIEQALTQVVQHMGIDRGRLVQFRQGNDGVSVLNFWECGRGLVPKPHRMDHVSHLLRHHPWFTDQLKSEQLVKFSSVGELPDQAAADKAFIAAYGPKSSLVVPLPVDGEVLGGLALSSLDTEVSWSREMVDRARLLARVAANGLASRRSKYALLEYRDQVNGLFDSSAQPMFYVGPEYVVNCSTPAAARLGFATRQELIGRPFWSFSAAVQADGLDPRSKLVQLFGRSLSGLPCRFPWRFQSRDGSAFETDLTLCSLSRGELMRFLILINGAEHNTADALSVEALRHELQNGRGALEERGVALRQAYLHIQEQRDQMNAAITSNKDRVIAPLLAKIKRRVAPEVHLHIDILEKALNAIASPFVNELSKATPALTPRELEVCNLIKQGLQSKEIAAAFSVSVRTVHKLRQKIRRKMDITNNDTDLGQYLRSTSGLFSE